MKKKMFMTYQTRTIEEYMSVQANKYNGSYIFTKSLKLEYYKQNGEWQSKVLLNVNQKHMQTKQHVKLYCQLRR